MDNQVTKTTEHLVITLDDLVVEFASNFSLGMKAVVAAAEAYVEAIKKYTRAREEFARRFPSIRPDTWRIIEDVGRGNLPPQATMMAPGAVAKLRDAKLPRKLFERVAEMKVSVYNPSTGRFSDVPFTHLTEMQADIVLNPVTHALRSVRQQKRYVAKVANEVAKAEKDKPRVEVKPWAIVEGGVLVKRMTTLTLEDIRAISKELGA